MPTDCIGPDCQRFTLQAARQMSLLGLTPAAATLLKDANAKVGFAEFKGDGLGSLERALAAKEKQMALLGGAVLTEARRGSKLQRQRRYVIRAKLVRFLQRLPGRAGEVYKLRLRSARIGIVQLETA